MRQNESLLQAILDSPADDTPRLVYSDWLEDHGEDDRAEFIRLQIELARMTLYDRRRPLLLRREYELFSRHGKTWEAPLVGRAARWEFRRGFVEHVKLNVQQLLAHGDMLWQLAPVRELKLEYPKPEEITSLASCPWLSRVESLDLSHSRMGDVGLLALLASPYLAGLRRLVLRWCGLSEEGLRVLAWTDQLPALEELDLSSYDLESEVIPQFISSCQLPRLTRLTWGYAEWSPALVQALAESPLLARLAALDLSNPQATEEQLRALLVAGRLDNLQELKLGRPSNLTPALVEALAANPSVRRLRRLEIACKGLGDAGAATLAAAPLADTLEELVLPDCDIGWAGVTQIAQSPRLGRLYLLGLGKNRIGDRGLRALARSEHPLRLQSLDLIGCGITSRGLRALLDSPLADRLGRLALQDNDIGPRLLRETWERFGEALEYDGMEDYYSCEWARANAVAHPPRCLSGFRVRADSPLAQRCHEEKLNPEWVAFELVPPSEEQRPVLLGHWFHPEHRGEDEKVLVSPLAVRWEPSGTVVEFFDNQQHGYTGVYDGAPEVHGTGPRIEWECPHPGCRDHVLLACFRYRDSPPERHRQRYFPPQEQFDDFRLYAYCRQRDAFEWLIHSECH